MTQTDLELNDEIIYDRIRIIRNQKVMLDSDLAALYQVDTKRLNEQVKRNSERFPNDFMFQLTEVEWIHLRSQIATSSEWGGRRTLPYVFTEHGVLMLSSVLSSKRAIAVNIQIMRVYVKLKEMITQNTDLHDKMNEIEQLLSGHEVKISHIFQYLEQFNDRTNEERTKVGYK